jgi:alkyl hydroperoxide reductase subunit AhpC
MKSIIYLLVSLCFSASILTAKEGYKLKLQVKNNTDSVLYLAHYFAKPQRVYKIDSAFADASGNYLFEADSLSNGGIYLLITKKNASVLEFLLQKGDNINLTFDRTEPTKTADFAGQKENTNFYVYQKYLIDLNKKMEGIQQEFATAKNKKDSAKAQEKNVAITKEVKKYRKDFVANNPNSLAANLFNSMEEPEIPEALNIADKKRGKNPLKAGEQSAYSFYKAHYWDKFDFENDAIMYTPIYDKKLEDYLKLVLSVPDSFNKEADILLKKCRPSKEMFKYTLNNLTYYAENSKVMGMDESFVYLVENYFMKGDAKAWMHDTILAKYVERAKAIAPTMLGQTVKDMRIVDINGAPITFSDFYKQQDYTLLIFYDPTCGHCKKEVPASDSTVKQLIKENIDIKIFGINNSSENEKWKELIKEKNLETGRWMHVHDPNRIGNFYRNYDVRTNPVLYIIDKKGTIVGKRIDHSNMAGLIRNIEKNNKNKL